MSPLGPESFQRLEEFPSFTSCIKCFGRPIIPPLLTPSRRHELKQLRIAAANKETELLRRKKELLNRQTQDTQIKSSKIPKDVYRSFIHCSMQESRALWYPSSKDCQEGISVAISKFPTSGIYSSVHTGAIVCSNVIEGSHTYTSGIARDSLFGSEIGVLGCEECSHNSINLECSLCQAECNQSFHNRSFSSEISPEVPCRTFSLLQPNANVLEDELNSTVEETECGSLPTVVSNQKYTILDTDSESNVTCMTQSTDLEKYMSFSYEFSSPDNSALVWDSKSSSQQYTLSRSDDASSETIVNTENELTPCASTMAELTDNIEDELSTAEENASALDNKDKTGALKRAHSVDSYMKIIQTCARSMNVKKSLSEPFNTNQEVSSNIDGETKTLCTPKTGLLIKEDSKESEESKEIPERDVSVQETNEVLSSNNDKDIESKSGDNDSFQKKHIRQSSYTLDHPSSVLILAHADCTCNFDAKCISPHCSALDDEMTSFTAFTKEKVDIDIPASSHQIKKLPIVCSENSSVNTTNTEQLTSSVVDVFPVVEEDNCEKSNSGNTNISNEELESQNTVEIKKNTEENPEPLNEKLSENLNVSNDDKNQEFLKCILEEFKEKNKIRAEQLYEEQKRQWLKLQEEFEEQEKLLYQKLNLTFISLTDSSFKTEEKSQINCGEDCNSEKACTSKLISEKKDASVLHSSVPSERTPTPDVSLIKSPNLLVPHENPQSYSSREDLNLPQNTRASFPPSTEKKSPIASPSKPLENVKDIHLNIDSEVSLDCNKHCSYSNVSESLPSMNGYASSMIPSLLPQSNYLPSSSNIVDSSYKKCDRLSTCFCDKSRKQCECCTSFNGYCGYSIDSSYPEHLPISESQNFVLDTKDLRSGIDVSCDSQNSSSVLSLQNNDSNHRDFLNCHTVNNSRKSPVSKKRSDFAHSAQDTTVPSFDNLELPLSVCSKAGKSILPHSSKEKTKLSVDTILSSVCSKTLKNGSFSPQDVSVNKRMIDDPVLMKKFEKLPAFVKGYLTRRLFKTERVQSLIKTLQDTALLIGKLSEDLSMKGDSVSERDVDFHRQLIVQLMTTFHNVYDIFCTISTKERMNIIAESRNFRLHQKILDQNPDSMSSVTTNAPDPVHKKHKLSSATLKALERKRRTTIDNRTYTLEDFKNVRSRSAIENRTYTIEDLKGFRGRTHSSMSAKNISISPSTIYKTSVGLALKRKTASIKSSRSRQNLHKWVP